MNDVPVLTVTALADRISAIRAQALKRTTELEIASPNAGRLAESDTFIYKDLYLHLGDADDEGAFREQAYSDLRLERAWGPERARCFYEWCAADYDPDANMFSAIIVNRVASQDETEVMRVFTTFDASGYADIMGTRRRLVYSLRGIYFHVQFFLRQEAEKIVQKAWSESDPRFVAVCDGLMRVVPPYKPEWNTGDEPDQLALALR